MSSIISWYASVICPLSPLARSLIIAAVVVIAIVYIRLMYIVEGWLRRPDLGLSWRFAFTALIAAHVDGAIVAAYAALHSAAEATCPAGLPLVRLVLPLSAAAAMLMFAWMLFWPHVSRRNANTNT